MSWFSKSKVEKKEEYRFSYKKEAGEYKDRATDLPSPKNIQPLPTTFFVRDPFVPSRKKNYITISLDEHVEREMICST